MADLSQVLEAVRDAASAVLYPDGVPTSGNSTVGAPVRVYVGWPTASLDADLPRGICHVSIYPRPGMARDLPPSLEDWVGEAPPASMAVTVDGYAATFTGTGAMPGMIAGVVVDGTKAYTYPLAAGDGPNEVAQALALLIQQDRSAYTIGPTLWVPGATRLRVRVAAGGHVRREIRRTVQGIAVSAWCPTAALRDAIAALLDVAFADERMSLPLPDGTSVALTYDGTAYADEARAQPLFRRDLLLSAEYTVVRVLAAPPIVVPEAILDHDPSRVTRTIIS